MKIVVTGATGFIGTYLVPRLLESGHLLRCFVRHSSDISVLPYSQVEIVRGNIIDLRELIDALQGQEAVIHLAHYSESNLAEHLRRVNGEMNRSLVSACRESGVKRVIAMSSTVATALTPSEYGSGKQEMESILSESGLEFTILRPGLVYGPGTRGVFWDMVKMLQNSPIIPIIGKGTYPLYLVCIDDVVAAICRCLKDSSTVSKQYDLAEEMAFENFLDLLIDILKLKKLKLHIPVAMAYFLADVGEKLLSKPPLRRDRIAGLLAEKRVGIQLAARDLGYLPKDFSTIKKLLTCSLFTS